MGFAGGYGLQNIEKKASKYFNNKYKNNSPYGLIINTNLLIFKPGSRTSRSIMEPGAGKGKVVCYVQFIELGSVIAAFDAYGSITMAENDDDIEIAIDKCVDSVIKFVNDHQ